MDIDLEDVFLVAISMANIVSLLQALSIKENNVTFFRDRLILKPDAFFLPKVVSPFHLDHELILTALSSSQASVEDPLLEKVDPVTVVSQYLEVSKVFRKAEKMFVIPAGPRRGYPASTSTIARWLVILISKAYQSQGKLAPKGSMLIVPILLKTVINDGAKISLIGCIVQLYIFGVTEGLQCFLLTVMSYDRYLAICNPLCYSSIMSHRFCVKLIVMSWLLALSFTSVTVITVATQEFCNQNTINHFFCDYFPLLELSCSDTSLAWILVTTLSFPTLLIPFMVITGSYICIAHEILKIKSNIGRQKAFSTCSSHLAVVSIFYGSLIVTYVVPTRNQSQTIGKLLSLLYTVVTPFINPMIYSLRSTHMIKAIGNIIQ
ncbi:olfactory receptor 10AG1-like [Xenopus laevis]|uniref:Olfactory receptor 10AG1-like n=1 Tax=Xenopus laevis TaxID=8355 RepID=A0A8J1MJQ9_XENLA|nr:olfactory receptor 10AG1-like [Xenopus laevis]